MLVFTSVDTLKAQNTFLFRHKKKKKKKKGKVVRWKQGEKNVVTRVTISLALLQKTKQTKKRQYRCFMQIR